MNDFIPESVTFQEMLDRVDEAVAAERDRISELAMRTCIDCIASDDAGVLNPDMAAGGFVITMQIALRLIVESRNMQDKDDVIALANNLCDRFMKPFGEACSSKFGPNFQVFGSKK